MKSHHYFILALIACSLFLAAFDRLIIADDTFSYLEKSEKIFHHTYRSVSQITGQPPFYPLLLEPSLLICGRTLIALHLFPIIFFLAIPLCLYFLGRQIFANDLVAFLCTLLYIIFPTNIRQLATPLTEPICVALILISFLLVEKCRRDLKYLPLFSLALALLFLTRYETILLIILEVFYLIYFLWKDRRISRRSFLWICLVLVVFQLPFAALNLSRGSLLPERAIYAMQLIFQHISDPATRMYPEYPPMRLLGVLYSIYLGGNPLLLLMIIGGIVLAWYRRSPLLMISSIWCVGLTGLIMLYGTNTWLIRHISKATPFICLLICFFLFEVWKSGLKYAKNRILLVSFAIVMTAPVLSMLYTAARDFRAFQDDARYSREWASLFQLGRTNPEIPATKDWYALRTHKLNAGEEVIRAVLGYARKPAYLKKRAEFYGLENFYSDFTETDFMQHLDGNEPVDRFWTDDGTGRLGVFPKFRDGVITFRFDFEKPLAGIEYCDRHIAWTRDDRVTMLYSLDGSAWDTWYNHARCYNPITFGTYRRISGENHHIVYLRYIFHAGDTRRGPMDNGGAAIEEMAFCVYFLQ